MKRRKEGKGRKRVSEGTDEQGVGIAQWLYK